MLFITADQHIGDNRLEILGRPFESQEEQINTIVTNHNKLVKADDLVIFNGDLIYDTAYLSVLDAMNGRKIVIRGNNDTPTDEQYLRYVEKVYAEGTGLNLNYNHAQDTWNFGVLNPDTDTSYYITHYPSLSVPHKFNLVGHIHAVWKVQKNMLNVGMDCHFFRPLPMKTVKFYETISF